LREELPWVGSGFIHRLPQNAFAAAGDLERLGFYVVLLDGTKITDRRSFHTQAAKAFAFPDDYAKTWDAFNECFGKKHLASRVAVLWTAAEQLATNELRTFAEAVAMFHEHGRKRAEQGIQLELFIGRSRPTS
jgi:RNAse (barnase) inhibitor barstar